MFKKVVLTGLIMAIVFASGCVHTNESKTTLDNKTIKEITSIQPELEVTKKHPSELILELTDLPSNYSIAERTPRLKSGVSEEGIKLGWKEGYYITYIRIGQNNTTVIEQLISIYSLGNISKVIELPKDSNENITYEELPSPKIGEKSRAFRIRIPAIDEFVDTIYEIEFIKMNVYEDIYMSGTFTDYELLERLAEKAAEKIS